VPSYRRLMQLVAIRLMRATAALILGLAWLVTQASPAAGTEPLSDPNVVTQPGTVSGGVTPADPQDFEVVPGETPAADAEPNDIPPLPPDLELPPPELPEGEVLPVPEDDGGLVGEGATPPPADDSTVPGEPLPTPTPTATPAAEPVPPTAPTTTPEATPVPAPPGAGLSDGTDEPTVQPDDAPEAAALPSGGGRPATLPGTPFGASFSRSSVPQPASIPPPSPRAASDLSLADASVRPAADTPATSPPVSHAPAVNIAGLTVDGGTASVAALGAAEAVSASVLAIATPRVPTTVSVAVEFGKAGHGWAGAVVFNLWLRRQLRERRMSQRQLAHLSGVDHSTISRLLRGGRIPSLDTATKLARALGVGTDEIGADLGFVRERPTTATQRVEAALRGDENLDNADVYALMEAYIARRRRKSVTILGSSGDAGHGSSA
jgi:transcriptional regulator with XRE-family HTH domain